MRVRSVHSPMCNNAALPVIVVTEVVLMRRRLAERWATWFRPSAQCSSKVQQPQRTAPTAPDPHWPVISFNDLQRPPCLSMVKRGLGKVELGRQSWDSGIHGGCLARCCPTDPGALVGHTVLV